MFAYNNPLLIVRHKDVTYDRKNTYKQGGAHMFYGIRPPEEAKLEAAVVLVRRGKHTFAISLTSGGGFLASLTPNIRGE